MTARMASMKHVSLTSHWAMWTPTGLRRPMKACQPACPASGLVCPGAGGQVALEIGVTGIVHGDCFTTCLEAKRGRQPCPLTDHLGGQEVRPVTTLDSAAPSLALSNSLRV